MYATRFSVSIIANVGFIPRHKVYSKWKNKRETKNISFIFIKISFKRRNENRKYKKMFTLHKTADFKLASFSKVENVVFCANRGQVSLAGLNFPLSLDVGDVVRPVDEDIVHTRDLTTAAFIQFLKTVNSKDPAQYKWRNIDQREKVGETCRLAKHLFASSVYHFQDSACVIYKFLRPFPKGPYYLIWH